MVMILSKQNDEELVAHVRDRFSIPLLDNQLAQNEQQELLLASLRRQTQSLLSYDPQQESWEPEVRPDEYWAAAKRLGVEWDDLKAPRLNSYLLDHHSGVDHMQDPATVERHTREDESAHYLNTMLLRVGPHTRLDWRYYLSHVFASPSTTLNESHQRFWHQFTMVEDPNIQQQLLALGVPQQGIERGIWEVRGKIGTPPPCE